MQIDSINNMTIKVARTAGMSRDFAQLLKNQSRPLGSTPGSIPSNTPENVPGSIHGDLSEASEGKDPARKASEQLVASTLILPLLKQMRDSPFGKPFLHGGLAEDTFGAQLDTILADRIVGKANFPIVDLIYQKMTARASGEIDVNA